MSFEIWNKSNLPKYSSSHFPIFIKFSLPAFDVIYSGFVKKRRRICVDLHLCRNSVPIYSPIKFAKDVCILLQVQQSEKIMYKIYKNCEDYRNYELLIAPLMNNFSMYFREKITEASFCSLHNQFTHFSPARGFGSIFIRF